MTRFIMSRLPYSWVKCIDFHLHRIHIPATLWQPLCDELERRYGVPEETLEQDRKKRQAQKWWER